MKRFLRKIVPLYALLPIFVSNAWNLIFYTLVGNLLKNGPLTTLSFTMDTWFPFVPAMVVFYDAFFLYVALFYIFVPWKGKEYMYRIFMADFLVHLVSSICFIVWPLTIPRPSVDTSNVFGWLTAMIYESDIKPVTALFPSLHCSVTVYVTFAFLSFKKLKWPWKVCLILFATGILLSTVMIRQHYLIDVFGGVILSVAMLFLCFTTKIYKFLEIPFEALNRKLGLSDDCIEGEKI